MAQLKLLDLPNELFLEVFKYLDVGQLFYSLYGLNTRLDILVEECHSHHLILDTADNFHIVLQHLKPDEIRSLTLPSNQQMLLFDELFANRQFRRNCQALFVCNIQPWDFIDLVPHLPQFKKLTSLSITRTWEIAYDQIYNKIFHLIIRNKIPTLRYLKLISPKRALFLPPAFFNFDIHFK